MRPAHWAMVLCSQPGQGAKVVLTASSMPWSLQTALSAPCLATSSQGTHTPVPLPCPYLPSSSSK